MRVKSLAEQDASPVSTEDDGCSLIRNERRECGAGSGDTSGHVVNCRDHQTQPSMFRVKHEYRQEYSLKTIHFEAICIYLQICIIIFPPYLRVPNCVTKYYIKGNGRWADYTN